VELISPYTVDRYKFRYIMFPTPIVLGNLLTEYPFENLSIDGITAEQTCELGESIHREILNRAVEIAVENYKPAALQTKMLTVLQNRVIYRLGSAREIPVNIRLICATNRPLKETVKEGLFREDLYYRINTFELTIPPLRERAVDIPLLLGHFLKKLSKKYNKLIPHIGDDLLNKLMTYEWPGNVRELQNAIERAIILNNGQELQLTDLFNDHSYSSLDKEEVTNLEELEKLTILKVLKNNHGNVTNTAKELGIHRNALYRRLEKHGL
jgi:two-component system response regulator HydG